LVGVARLEPKVVAGVKCPALFGGSRRRTLEPARPSSSPACPPYEGCRPEARLARRGSRLRSRLPSITEALDVLGIAQERVPFLDPSHHRRVALAEVR